MPSSARKELAYRTIVRSAAFDRCRLERKLLRALRRVRGWNERRKQEHQNYSRKNRVYRHSPRLVDTGILRFDPEISFEFRVSYQTLVPLDRLQEFRLALWSPRASNRVVPEWQ